MILALKKTPGVGEGEEYMTTGTLWFHYLDHGSYMPVVYPASLLYHKCRYHHSEKGTYLICIIMKILLILWTPWKVLEKSTVRTLRIAVIQGVWTSTVNKVLRKAFLRKWFLSQAKGTIAHVKGLMWAKLYVSSRNIKYCDPGERNTRRGS